MSNVITPRTLFLSLQKSLLAELEVSRTSINHSGTKGDATEANWITMLDKYLPKRYQASKAFVIDADGNMSDQLDLVIHDRQYSPFLFNHASALYIPAESVYAVFEIKQKLHANHIDYAGKKIASVRNLRRTSAKVTHAGGTYEPRTPFKIIGGILTLQSDWSPPFSDSFYTSLNKLTSTESIDLGCCLKDGAFTIDYYEKKLQVTVKDGDVILLSFFLQLLAKLQSLGTALAIDISAYEKWVD